MPYQICHHGFQIAYRPTFSLKKNLFMTDRVKCNRAPIITLKLTLTSIRSVLLLKHNKGVEYMSNNKPYQYTYTKPMQVSMPESLYSVVYSETAFRGLTQHPSHFHTIADAQAFIDDCVKPYKQDAYIIQVPVIATSIQS